jgi:hypothetical protein
MTKRLACSFALAAASLAAASAAAADPPLKTETGRLQDLIARLASRDYVLGESHRDERPYIDPSPVLNAFRHVAAALAWGDVSDAARKAADIDYEIVNFIDAHTDAKYYVLREDLSRVDAARGWGSYILNPESRVDALVEVPHPLADAQTPEIGGAVFERAEAKGFLLAGTHREKADVPDLVDSIFHQVHMAWVGPAAQVAAWQIHGFARQNHSFPRGAHVVASTGDGVIAPEVASLDRICENQGLKSYVFNDRPAESRANKMLNDDVPGVTFSSLAATTNEQGRLSRSLGGSFVHVELESVVRLDEEQRERAATVIAAAMSAPAPELAAAEENAEVTLRSETSDDAPAIAGATTAASAVDAADYLASDSGEQLESDSDEPRLASRAPGGDAASATARPAGDSPAQVVQ